jgi:hypothetical protein
MTRQGLGLLAICMVLVGASMALAQDLQAKAPPARPKTGVVQPLPAAQGSVRKGVVTNLLVPRYVTLKTNQGNARRGPGLYPRRHAVAGDRGI